MNMQILTLSFIMAVMVFPMACLALDSWLEEAGGRRDAMNKID